jgi:porphyrinogen peroxidase
MAEGGLLPCTRDIETALAACGKSFDAFEAPLRSVSGAEGGLADALCGFTRAVIGAYFWRPPMHPGRRGLRAPGR